MTNPTRTENRRNTPPDQLMSIYDHFEQSSDRTVKLASVLLDNIDDIDLDRPDILMSLELARMDSGGSPQQRDDLFLLILASIVAKQCGSVRFSLNDNSSASLANRLRDNLSGILDVIQEDDSIDLDGRGEKESFWQTLSDNIHALIDDPDSGSVIGHPDDDTPLVLTGDQLYHQSSHARERRLATEIRNRVFEDSPDAIPLPFVPEQDVLREKMAVVNEASAFPLTPKQQYGILTATCSPLSVVTGGPGTGKTSIVLSLVRFLVELGIAPEEIAIAAPTGKAANRLGESLIDGLDPDRRPTDATIADELDSPSTLHRLLGYSEQWEQFYYHENRPLPHRYVIVDEASMIDLSLMEQLFSAVADTSALCLIGDADQLPAVESGAVFRDLVPDRENPDVPWHSLAPDPLEVEENNANDPLSRQAIRLQENFRVKGGDDTTINLVRVSEAINNGGEGLSFAETSGSTTDGRRITVRSSFDELQFEAVELFSPSEENGDESNGTEQSSYFHQLLEQWYDRWLSGRLYGSETSTDLPNRPFPFQHGEPMDCGDELDALFDDYARAQLLSVTRHTPFGVRRINEILHQYHRRTWEFYDRWSNRQFLPGEPIIMMRNDYDRRLFNGEQGLVLLVKQPSDDDPAPMAVFPGIDGYRAYHLGPLRSELNHAFALTVHKSQGSEYGSVGIVLPRRDVPLMTRELLYTAVTRAEYGSVFFGSPERLREGARRKDIRNSGLVERI